MKKINEAIRLLAQHGKQVAEGAGAASLAAAIKVRDQCREERGRCFDRRQYSDRSFCSPRSQREKRGMSSGPSHPGV